MAKTELKTTILLRNDKARAWSSVNPTLSKGEIGVETDTNKMKIGDGSTQWNSLKYFGGTENSYQDNITEDGKAIGDIAVVKTLISEGKYSYTSYVWNGSAWAAMDGNYNAENVYFDEDLISTYAIGNISLTNGQGTIASTGKNLKEVWSAVFQKESNPTVDTPTVTLTATSNSEGEVGTTFNLPTATLKVTDIGSYTYGPTDTGVRFPIGSLTLKQSDKTTNSVSNTSEYKKDNTITLTASDTKGTTYGDSAITYSFEATSKYKPNENVIPVTNLGNERPTQRIGYGATTNADGTITLVVTGTPKKTTYTGFRKMFWGTMQSKPETMSSADIRGLGGLKDSAKANGVKTATGEKSLTIPVGAKRVVIAVPSARTMSKVLDVNDSNANIVGSFSSTKVQVNGANSYTAAEYTVYYIDYANATTVENTYKVTIA